MEEIMNNTVLEFGCIGMDNGSKFPIEYTGRGQDMACTVMRGRSRRKEKAYHPKRKYHW